MSTGRDRQCVAGISRRDLHALERRVSALFRAVRSAKQSADKDALAALGALLVMRGYGAEIDAEIERLVNGPPATQQANAEGSNDGGRE